MSICKIKKPAALVLALSGFSLPFAGAVWAEETADTDAVAIVNGTPITAQSLELYSRMRASGDGHGEQQQTDELVTELVNRELIYQDALARKLDKDPQVQAEFKEQERNIMTSYRIRELLEKSPPTEKQMKKVYQEQVVERASKEYKARHILTENEADAKALIGELRKGADFAELAKEKSTGPSAKDGGDLGWFSANQMVKPFADAVMRMKPGKYSNVPVETQFGWHVILLEDVRDVEPPSFERMRPQIEMVVKNQIIGDYIKSLRKDAQVEIK